MDCHKEKDDLGHTLNIISTAYLFQSNSKKFQSNSKSFIESSETINKECSAPHWKREGGSCIGCIWWKESVSFDASIGCIRWKESGSFDASIGCIQWKESVSFDASIGCIRWKESGRSGRAVVRQSSGGVVGWRGGGESGVGWKLVGRREGGGVLLSKTHYDSIKHVNHVCQEKGSVGGTVAAGNMKGGEGTGIVEGGIQSASLSPVLPLILWRPFSFSSWSLTEV
ncbi:hypothetical protein LIER_07256 [Lithospermum erythrorhizon]|uniref:Uncharacterized protein n=1 Tax=Lithospermum erythrorhizon TaxID=34254 RepID=A0AAV3P7J6_LITER